MVKMVRIKNFRMIVWVFLPVFGLVG